DVWGGVREGMVQVQGFGPAVPDAVRREVLSRRDEIAAGRLHPFRGPVTDQDGHTVLKAGEVMPDARILGMDFLVAGVSPRLPRSGAPRTP
ncbi:MAG: hypothetical protein RJA29_1577, partial [Pseudomonadota bacterium]